jgi:medium-chain acyl-[acyl-carrier-protein] hydrolase
VTTHPVAEPRFRIFCFPYAGGSAAAFSAWERFLPEGVELFAIQYKGRGTRVRELPASSIEAMVEDVRADIGKLIDRPYAFFGHSMGTGVAYELTHRLASEACPLPTRLFLSGRRAPHLPLLRKPIHVLPDAEFIQSISQMNGTPAQVLGNKELMASLLPVLRADFTAVDTWSGRPAKQALDIPFTLFGGKNDPLTPVEDLQAWSDLTRAGADTQIFHGGHFFLRQHYPVMLKRMWRDLGLS